MAQGWHDVAPAPVLGDRSGGGLRLAPRALTLFVEGLAHALGTQHAQLLELHRGVRLEQDIDAAHQGCGALPAADGLGSVVQGQQAGGAGRVQRQAGPCSQGQSRGVSLWGPAALDAGPTASTHL